MPMRLTVEAQKCQKLPFAFAFTPSGHRRFAHIVTMFPFGPRARRGETAFRMEEIIITHDWRQFEILTKDYTPNCV